MTDSRSISIRGIPRDVWLKAAAAAKLAGKNVGQYVTEALREKLAKPAKK